MQNQWPEFFQPDVVREAFGGTILSSFSIALEAWRRGLEVTITHPQFRTFEISDSTKTVKFNGSRADSLTPREALRAAIDKKQTTDLLRSSGISAPESHLFTNTSPNQLAKVLSVANSIGYPIVLKPVDGSKGEGVLTGIENDAELERSFAWFCDNFAGKKFVLEKHHHGDDYRVYVVEGQFAAACQRIAANVVGDGTCTIDELIKTKNVDRSKNPFVSNALIKKDFETDTLVAEQNYTYDSVPPAGEVVFLRRKANASAGGDSIDVSESLPEHIKQAAIASVQAIPGLTAAGVDVLFDPSLPAGKDYSILELNSRAHIGVNMYPTSGPGQDVPKTIVDAFFPGSKRLELPNLKRIVFSLEECLRPLRNGHATSMTLSSIPKRGYRTSRVFDLDPTFEFSDLGKSRIYRMARKSGVVGRVRLSKHKVIVSGTSSSIREFIDEFIRINGSVVLKETVWKGPIRSGFAISID